MASNIDNRYDVIKQNEVNKLTFQIILANYSLDKIEVIVHGIF